MRIEVPIGHFLALASSLLLAQQGGIGAIKFDPANMRAGQEVKITIAAEGEAPVLWSGLGLW